MALIDMEGLTNGSLYIVTKNNHSQTFDFWPKEEDFSLRRIKFIALLSKTSVTFLHFLQQFCQNTIFYQKTSAFPKMEWMHLIGELKFYLNIKTTITSSIKKRKSKM